MSFGQPSRVEIEVPNSHGNDEHDNVQPFPLSSKFDFQSISSDWQQSNSYGDSFRVPSSNHHDGQRENRQFPRYLYSSEPNNAAYDDSPNRSEHYLPDNSLIERHVHIPTGEYAAYSIYSYQPHWQQQATSGQHWYPGAQHYQHTAQHRHQLPYADQQPATYEQMYHWYGDGGQQRIDSRSMLQGQSQESHHLQLHHQPRRTYRSSKRKRKRDENEPKRALTAYNLFFKRQRAIMLGEDTEFEQVDTEKDGKGAQAHAGGVDKSESKSSSGDTTSRQPKNTPRRKVGFAEMARRVSKSWQEASDKEKLAYRKLADQDKVRYDIEKAAYDAKMRERAMENSEFR